METLQRQQILRGWMRGFGLLLLVYMAAYALSMWALLAAPHGILRSLLVLAPVVPGLLLIANGVLAYQRCDEFVRQYILKSAAASAVAVAVATLLYAYLELIGLPHLNIGIVHAIGWPVFCWQMVRLMRMSP